MITISLVENKKVANGKKEIEKRKFQMKKPKSLKDFKNFLLTEFNTNNSKSIRIYSIDWEGEASEIKDDDDFKDDDNKAFKVIYDKDFQDDDIEKDNKSNDSQSEKDNDAKDESFDSINEEELISILDEELKDEKKENVFDSKIFCDNLLKDFISKQNSILDDTKSKIDSKIENIMNEKSQIFIDLKNIPQIQESIIKTTNSIIQASKIEQKENKKENSKPKKIIQNEIIKEEEEEKEEFDLRFLKNEITLPLTAKEAKYFEFKVKFQNIGKKTFIGGDLYFFKEENSSEDFYFAGVQRDQKQDICLQEALEPTKIAEESITIRNEDPIEGKDYILIVLIKSNDKYIKMKEPLKITIKIKQDIEELQEKERLEKERIENERLEKERTENELKEKERIENEIKEKERIENERKEKERIENERKEKEKEKERIEKERKEKEEKEKLEMKQKEEEEKKKKESEGDGEDDFNQKVEEIYNDLEERFYISDFKQEEEVKEMIRNLNCNKDKIEQWIETIM